MALPRIPLLQAAILLSLLGQLISPSISLKLPFRATDVLPLLPRELSWPILNTLHSATDLLPSFVGSIAPHNGTTQWRGSCFQRTQASLRLTSTGAVLQLQTAAPHSWACMDLYVFATPYRVTWDYYISQKDHEIVFSSWEETAEEEHVKQHGVSVFLMPSGMLGTLLSMIDVLPLFSNSIWGQNANLAFLKKHMNTTFEPRNKPWMSEIDVDDIQTGDFLAVSKIRGRWGAFETLEKWVTGASAGHTAVCLRDENGNVFVGESGHENDKGEEIIALIPWDEWWEFALKDESNPQISLLRLHPDILRRFNTTAAWDYARSMSGKPYGYHNMIFSWIDTLSGNYPPPIDSHLVISVISMWTRLRPSYAANMWNEALNKRMQTEGLDLNGIMEESERRGMRFDELLTIPEQDDWVYSDGKSTTCVAFVLAMYKAAGIFDPIGESVQVTEFTIKDAYMLKIYEDEQKRMPKWCGFRDGETSVCQILGGYWMEFNGFNSVEPYAHMNENCPSYERPNGC